MRILSGLQKALSVLQLTALAAFIIYAGFAVWPKAFGLETGVVMSGSMEPDIAVGSICYIRKADAAEVFVGDVIAFRAGSEELELEVIHRVVGKDDKRRQFATKGDNNASEDNSPVPYTSLVGVVVGSVPYIGYISVWFAGHFAQVIAGILCIPACGLLLSRMPQNDRMREKHAQADGKRLP